MTRLRHLTALVASSGMLLALQIPIATSVSAAGPQTLVVGVGHFDPGNQDFAFGGGPGRVFQYTDFFTRDVALHRGDTLNLQTAGNEFHVIALAKNAAATRASLPLIVPDGDDAAAPGSGRAKLAAGPGFAFVNQAPSCGLAAQPNCDFNGALLVAGGVTGFGPSGPAPVDWNVTIDGSTPLGTYNFFCFIHPKMTGTLRVVAADEETTSQAAVNERSAEQFQSEREQALEAEADASKASSERHEDDNTLIEHVGLSAADNHVAILEMLPKELYVKPGDRVEYRWSFQEVHTASFPTDSPILPNFVGFDCGTSFVGFGQGPPCPEAGEGPAPEIILDPGNQRPGVLADPSALVNSGVLAGSGYRIPGSTQRWPVVASKPGTYSFQCTIHDWMRATVTVG